MPLFIPRSEIIQAERYDGSSTSAHRVMDMIGTRGVLNTPEGLRIFRPGVAISADKGDWILRGPDGDLTLCKPDFFKVHFQSMEDLKSQQP